MNPKELSSDRFYKHWVLVHSILNLLAVGYAYNHEGVFLWLVLNLISFTYFVSGLKRHFLGFPAVIGYANWVTIFRLGMIFTLGFWLDRLSNNVLFTLFAVAIALDGLDGYMARKFRQQSEYGARIDMETDAFLVMLLTLHHVREQTIPEWILLPALMRFLFGIATYFLETREVTSRMFRATIAVVFFVSLLLAFVLPTDWTYYLISVAGGLILLSFGISVFGIRTLRHAK